MTENIFEIKKLSKSFGNKEVLSNLTFNIHKGELLGIVGKSGAGKSTFLKILSKIISYKGKIIFNDKILTNKSFDMIIGFSFQPYSFYDELTLLDNLLYFGRLYGLDKKEIYERINELFSITDLDINDLLIRAKNLSGGMKKRFDIVCSILHYPDILILDEPTAGLDPLRRKQLVNIIKRINSTGTTILISSHIMADIDGVCDRVLVIDKGRNLILDTPSRIKSELLEHEQIIIKSYPGKYDKIIKYLRNFNIIHCNVDSKKLIIYTPESEIFIHFILHLLENQNEVLESITITEPDLGDVFDVLEKESEKTILKDNIKIINQFIHTLIGKNYSEKKIKGIMLSHKWPKEISDVLVGKQIIRELNQK